MKPKQVDPPPIESVKKNLRIISETHQIIVEILELKAKRNFFLGLLAGVSISLILFLLTN